MKKTQTVKAMTVERGEFMRPAASQEKPSKEIKEFVKSVKKINESHDLRIFVAGGARSGDDPIYEKEAFKLGQQIGKMHFRLFFGLAGAGIMGAVARGVLKEWAEQHEKISTPIKGFTTQLYMSFNTEKDSPIVDQVKDVLVAHTLEERKNGLLAADFVVFAPGGLGTLDELAYDCVAMQDGFLPLKPFIVFNVDGYYHHLLEYLKEIVQKGFARPVPFIVVDNAKEAGIVFEVLKELYQKQPPKGSVFDFIEKLIYYMPYIFEKKKNSKISIADLLKEMKENENNLKYAVRVEKAYLRKETERMYQRLERAGQDTAAVSMKLSGLKQRKRNF